MSTENTIKAQIKSILDLDLDKFYVVTIRDDSAQLQGFLTQSLREYCEKTLDVKFELVDGQTWIKGTSGNIEVVLSFQ